MAANMRARRRLNDLFKEGVEIRFGRDEAGRACGKIGPFTSSTGGDIPLKEDEVAIFVRPPDPLQRDTALRKANAKRAEAVVRAKRERDSEEHLTILAFLSSMSDETLIDYILLSDRGPRQMDAIKSVEELRRWRDRDLMGHREAIRKYDDVPVEDLVGDEEWQRLVAVEEEFLKDVEQRDEELREQHRKKLRGRDRVALEEMALERRSELAGQQAFVNEYHLQMLFYCARDPDDYSKMFFEDVEDMSRQSPVVVEKLSEALSPFLNVEDEE